MSGFFSLENPFFQFMSKLCDVILISILYVILCLPIVTIGPATTALYYTMVKVVRRERGYVFREFFRSFKQNFKSGLFLTIVLILCFMIIYVDRRYAVNLMKSNGTVGYLLYCLFNVVGVLLIMTTLYAFPVLSRFTIKGFQILKTSLFMAIRHLPSTIIIGIIVLGSVFMTRVILFLIFVMPGACCLLVSLPMERIFKKYMPETEGNPEETGKDEWYLE